MTDDNTPMECRSLDQSRDERVQAELIRNRRLMCRAYARSYSSDDAHPLPAPEPVLEQSGFAPMSEQAKICFSPCKYCGGEIHGHPYYASFVGEQGHHACHKCHEAGKVKPGNGKPLPGWENVGTEPLPGYWTGFAHGFCVALGGVLVLTGVLLWKGMP